MMYKCNKKVLHPPKGFIKCNCSDDYKESVGVDECLADEIEDLWRKGIKTMGCCCGHGKSLGFIQVRQEYINTMERLGYVHYIYEDEFGGKDRLDAFIPKSYGHIFNGYTEFYSG